MKLILSLSLGMSFAYGATPAEVDVKTTPPTFQYEEYEPNDGSARPGNPGTFTSKGPKSNVPETNLEMKNHPKPKANQEMQAEEAEFDDEVLK